VEVSAAAPINRCVCRDVTFERLLELAAGGAGLDDLQRRTGCGTGCGLCVPYIRAALATGRARLPIMSGAELARWAQEKGPDPAV
jgi:bacterioferritin-associated ferredoxin